MKNVNIKSVIFSLVLTMISVFSGYYLFLPAINLQDSSFWWFLIYQSCFYCFFKNLGDGLFSSNNKRKGFTFQFKWKQYLLPMLIFFVYFIGVIFSLKIGNASSYADILKVNEEADFNTDIVNAIDTDAIALMDTDSARMLGDREIGSLSQVVSQYDVSNYYTQIDLNGKPIKVSPLEYAGFFKWMNNKTSGVPGYVTVDPVSMSADYHDCEDMIYVPSAYFGQDLYRYVRSKYPTEMLSDFNFEIDEEGNPYYILPTYKKTIGLFGGKTVKGIIVLNPCNGELVYYAVEDVPRWIDVVFSGDLICEQYNWYGQLKNGYFNALFGKKGCKKVTEYIKEDAEEDFSNDLVPSNDYGYIAKDGDIWIYTGVTSVNNDSSNIGFLLANERTGEARFYSISGADEFSAMSAAEGEVQEKGYQASFPSLINIDGVPTYIMVLKDASGLVKMYAAVNVEQYNMVVTADTQEACIIKYRSIVGEKTAPPDIEVEVEKKVITSADLRYIVRSGDTYLYIITDEQEIYSSGAIGYDDNVDLLLLKPGDVITIWQKDGFIESWAKEGNRK